jgi:hypothetical protein
MDRNVSPKVLWIVGAVIAGVVVAIAIIGYRDGQLMEQDRQAEREAQRQAAEQNADYAASHPTTDTENTGTELEDSNAETEDSQPDALIRATPDHRRAVRSPGSLVAALPLTFRIRTSAQTLRNREPR